MKRFSLLVIVAAMGLAVIATGCKPKYPSCKKDAHCHEGEYCINGQCQQCRDNADCALGQSCASGACREIADYCKQSSDCAEGQVCRDKRCGPCLASGDCSDGLTCMDGHCGKAECVSDEDCPAGLDCRGHKCAVQEATPLAAGSCSLQTVYFEFDSSELSTDQRRLIEENYRCMETLGRNVMLEGHCDPRGTTEYNLSLGDRRARSVAGQLKALGAESGRMDIVSKGEEDATGTSEDAWIKDRRVDFK